MPKPKGFRSSDAYRSAVSNARYFHVPYVVFVDTNGNWRANSYRSAELRCFAVVWPDGHQERSTVEVTAGELVSRYNGTETEGTANV